MVSQTDFSGTNTDKIDKLVATVIELRSTLRLCYYLMGTSLPLVVMLLTFLVTRVYETSAKVDRLNDRLERMDREFTSFNERLAKLERPKPP